MLSPVTFRTRPVRLPVAASPNFGMLPSKVTFSGSTDFVELGRGETEVFKPKAPFIAFHNQQQHQFVKTFFEAVFLPIIAGGNTCQILDGPTSLHADQPATPGADETYLIKVLPEKDHFKVTMLRLPNQDNWSIIFLIQPVPDSVNQLQDILPNSDRYWPELRYEFVHPKRHALPTSREVHLTKLKLNNNYAIDNKYLRTRDIEEGGYEQFEDLATQLEDFGRYLETMIRQAQEASGGPAGQRILRFP